MIKFKTVLCFGFVLLVFNSAAEIINIPDDQPTIQAGIDIASEGDTILVQPGQYGENINFTGKNVTVASLFILTNDTSYISQTIIDGSQNGSVVVFENQENETARLIGFTIQNGLCGNNFSTSNGGGICCIGSDPTLEHLIVKENSTEYRGGGISCEDCDPIIQHCSVLNNNAEMWGGGINCYNSNPNISECIVMNNAVYSNGGGGILCSDNSNPLIINCTISNNIANNGGGAIHCRANSSPELTNVILSSNHANYDGGGLYTHNNSYPTLVDCIISYNTAGNRGGGIRPGSTVHLEGVTIKENYAEEGGGIYIYNNSSIDFDEVNRCNIYSNYALVGNDLCAGSPCTVVVDTFTVLEPTQYHIWIPSYFTFDIQHAYYNQTSSDLYVSPNGNDHNSGLSWGNPLKTIRCALSRINTTLSDATIRLGPGIYNSNTGNKHFPIPIPIYGLTLKGSGTNNTIIDAGYETYVIHMELVSENTLSDFTVSGGLDYGIYEEDTWLCTYDSLQIKGNQGHGIYSKHSFDITFDNLIVHDNQDGIGIYIYNSDSIYINNSIIYNNINQESGGGGLKIDGGTYASLTDLSIFNNRSGGVIIICDATELNGLSIRNNHAISAGGLYISSDNVTFSTINKCNIYCNHAGRANDIWVSSQNIDIILDTFTVMSPTKYHIDGYNELNSYEIDNYIHSQVNQDLFVSTEGDDNNTGLNSSEPLKTIGTALSKILTDSTTQRIIHIDEGLYSNESNGELFPLAVPLDQIGLEGSGEENTILEGENIFPIMLVTNANKVQLNNLTIQNGWGNYGGAIICNNTEFEIENVKICNNYSEHGSSALYVKDGCNLKLHRVCISENQTGDDGGAIYTQYSSLQVSNSTIANNISDFGGALHQSYGSNSVIVNSILWNDSPNEITISSYYVYDTVSMSYTNIQGGENGVNTGDYGILNYLEGNIDQEPMFDSVYSLLPGSPCIDAGTDYFNWQGDTIVYFPAGTFVGEAPDMGAYESGLGIGIQELSSQYVINRDDFSIKYSFYGNPESIIIQLSESTFLNFSLHNISGKRLSASNKIRNSLGTREINIHSIFPEISILPSGIYLITMQTKNNLISKKMILY